MLSSSTLKSLVGSLPTVPQPNGSQPKTLPMLKLNKSFQLRGKVESPLQEISAAVVARRELLVLAAATLGGLALFAAEPADALEVADIGSSIKELLGFSKGKQKTGAGNEKNPKVENETKPKMEDKGKPKSEGDVKKPKVEDNGKKPKNEEKPKVEGNGDKPKNEEKPKLEGNGNRPKTEADQKKVLAPRHSEKEKVSSSSAAPTLPNILNSAAP